MQSHRDFYWKPHYSVGHKELDLQHQQLFRLCKRASDCASGKLENEDFHEVINDLAGFALKHIEYEESLLSKCNYSLFAEQEKDHYDFLVKIMDYVDAAMNRTVSKNDIADYVWRWWYGHVLVSDMKYKDTIQATV
jgi:hemerythrin-like metal-binding protein